MNPFFEIRVNNIPIDLLQQPPSVESLTIKCVPNVHIKITNSHTKAIAEWLYNLTQQVDYVDYNGVLIQKEDINKPSHLS